LAVDLGQILFLSGQFSWWKTSFFDQWQMLANTRANTCGCVTSTGMLLMGFALRNIRHIDIAKDIEHTWSSALRSGICLVKNLY